MKQLFYSGLNKDNSIAKKSSSGGAFSALTDAFFENNKKAVVYGCILNEDFQAVHIRADNKELRDKMRGSKYIGSNLTGVYKNVAEDLQSGLSVLFSGTPCQIGALLGYISKKNISEEKLFTVDFVCHGVASSKFFEDYIKHLENKYKSRAVSCNFRGKSKPGKKQDMIVKFENGKVYNASSSRYDWFYSIYLKNLILRTSCYKCKYAQEKRYADLTIADLWGKLDNSLVAKSLVVVNSEKGAVINKQAEKYMDICEIASYDVHQPHMRAPAEKPENYDWFWNIYLEKGYLLVQKAFGNNTLKGKLMSGIADVLYRLNLINFIKKCLKRK